MRQDEKKERKERRRREKKETRRMMCVWYPTLEGGRMPLTHFPHFPDTATATD